MSIKKHIPGGGFEPWAAFLEEASLPLQNSPYSEIKDSLESPSPLDNSSAPIDIGAGGKRRSHCS